MSELAPPRCSCDRFQRTGGGARIQKTYAPPRRSCGKLRRTCGDWDTLICVNIRSCTPSWEHWCRNGLPDLKCLIYVNIRSCPSTWEHWCCNGLPVLSTVEASALLTRVKAGIVLLVQTPGSRVRKAQPEQRWRHTKNQRPHRQSH